MYAIDSIAIHSVDDDDVVSVLYNTEYRDNTALTGV